MTIGEGNYELSVIGDGIEDYGRNAATNSLSTQWARSDVRPVVVTVGPVTPDPRKEVVTTVLVVFSKQIDSHTFTSDDLQLTRDSSPLADFSDPVNFGNRVANSAPVAEPGGPYVIGVGEDISLDASGSSDPNAACGDSIVSYEWDLNADGSYEYSGATLTVPWANLAGLPQDGTPVPLSLLVTDTFGATGEATAELRIYEDQPFVVTAVRVGTTAWAASFLDAVDSEMTKGYPIPMGTSQQTAPLPWNNVDQISITFSQDAQVSAEHLAVYGINTPSYEMAEGRRMRLPMTPTPTPPHGRSPHLWMWQGAAFSLGCRDQPGRNAIGWKLDRRRERDSREWRTGGDFNFRFNVLPGDANQNQLVAADDALTVIGKIISLPLQPKYSVFADINGNGLIAAEDALLTIGRIISILPQGEPVAAAAPAVGQHATLLVASPAEIADINANGVVDFSDFVALANGFGSTNATWSQGDLDRDRDVDFDDFEVLAKSFGATLPMSPQAIDMALRDELTSSPDDRDDDLDVALQDDLDQTIEDLLLATT